jgi:hypothetical protein
MGAIARYESGKLESQPEFYILKKKISQMKASLHMMLYTAQMMRTLMLDLLDIA